MGTGKAPSRTMVHLLKSIWLLVSSLHIPGLTSIHETYVQRQTPKSIAVIGAGSAGIAVLKAFQDLPTEIRANWNITLYEQREDVAGVWCVVPKSTLTWRC